jgi:hypothetical protein
MIRIPNDSAPDRKWRVIATVVTCATVVGSGYFLVAGLVDPGALVPGGDTAAARTLGAYFAVRNAVLLGAAVWFLATRSWRRLGLLLALNGAVQVLDGTIGLAHHQAAQTAGPLIFAAALFTAAVGLART